MVEISIAGDKAIFEVSGGGQPVEERPVSAHSLAIHADGKLMSCHRRVARAARP